MPETKRNVAFPPVTEGVIRTAAIRDAIAPKNSVQDCVNLNHDSLGSATGRLGITDYTGAIPDGGVQTIISLGTLVKKTTGLFRLIAQQNADIYAWNGSTWSSSLKTFVNNARVRYAEFLGLTYMVNGNANDTISTYDGSTVGVMNIGTLTKGDYLCVYQGRMWLADNSTDRVYYTDIVDPSGNVPITGGVQYISTLSPQDGQSISGMVQVPRALLVFKQNEIFRVYSPSSVDPYPAYLVGTYSNESIVTAKDGIYFHHPTGFYKFNYNTQPQDLSQRIIDFVQAIIPSNYDKVEGWADYNHVYWKVGDVTIGNRFYKNAVYRYTISTQIWTIYSYGHTLQCTTLYDDGSQIVEIVGTEIGVAGQINNGFNDLGKEIFCEQTGRWLSFLPTFANLQEVTGVTVLHENCEGMNVNFETDKEGNWLPQALALKDSYADPFPGVSTPSFNRIRYRFYGSYNKSLPVFENIEFTVVDIQGTKEN